MELIFVAKQQGDEKPFKRLKQSDGYRDRDAQFESLMMRLKEKDQIIESMENENRQLRSSLDDYQKYYRKAIKIMAVLVKKKAIEKKKKKNEEMTKRNAKLGSYISQTFFLFLF